MREEYYSEKDDDRLEWKAYDNIKFAAAIIHFDYRKEKVTMSVKHFTIKDVATWYQRSGRQIFLGDVLDEKNSDAMSVGFCRYQKGET
ncbi:MAG: hypothetical protein ACREXS_07195 [Gammaproteobacteria bacterium]